METEFKQEWVDKYRPTNLDNYVLDLKIKNKFKDMIRNNNLQHFTLIGAPGSGKTTLAKIMANEFNAETLFIKCATEGTIDILRSKVEPFCQALTLDGKIKLIILDELDAATSTTGNGSSFQMGLRTLIEAHQDDCRFICTANYNKVIPAVLSRCPVIPLHYDKKDLIIFIKNILDNEKILYTKNNLKIFLEESIRFYPDCRKIIKYLQLCCNSGKLVIEKDFIDNDSKIQTVIDIINTLFKNDDILNVRKFYLSKKELLNDYLEIGSILFNYVIDNNLINEDGILKLSDMIYQLNIVVDKEPIFFGMLIAIKKFKK